MSFLQMPAQPLWKGKRTSLAPFDSAGKRPFMGGKVFSHGLDEFENLAAGWTCEILNRRCWAMFGLEVSDQCLFGGVSLAAFLAPVPLLLPTGSQMKVRHSSGGENLAAATAGPTCLPGVSLHVVFETSGALKALVTELALSFPSLNFGNFKRDILTGGPSAHPYSPPRQNIFKYTLCPSEVLPLHPDSALFLRNCRCGRIRGSSRTQLCSGGFSKRWCRLLKPPGDS